MTATRPAVLCVEALIVARMPRNQRGSPSTAVRALGAKLGVTVVLAGEMLVIVCLLGTRGIVTRELGDGDPTCRSLDRGDIPCAPEARDPSRHVLALVPAGRWQVDRLVEDVGSLGSRGLPREEYCAEVTARLRKVVPSVAACWHTLDAQTRLMTSDAPHELVSSGVLTAETVTAAGELLVASEYFVSDVNTFAGLARRRVTVGTLSQATGRHPDRSARYRDLLAPSGIPHELRAAFVSRGRCWGAVHIARRDDQPDFTSEEVAALGSPRTVAVPTSSGWITLHAALPDGTATDRVAVVLERAPGAQSTAIQLEAHGVTAREREIAGLLARGLTNPEIAERLVVSPYTIQDHIKSLFEKTNVSSRQELVARIFVDDYLPHLVARTPPAPRAASPASVPIRKLRPSPPSGSARLARSARVARRREAAP